MAGLFGNIIAGAAQGLGMSIQEMAKSEREQRMKELDFARQSEFSRSERIAGQEFTAAQNKENRSIKAAPEPFTLGEGQSRYGPDGSLIAAGPAKKGFRQLTPDEIKQRGLDPAKAWQIDEGNNKIDPVGGGGVNVTVGDGGMKLTEGQSKDLSFFTRGLYANDDLTALDDELTSAGGNILGRFGTVGNFWKDPKYRQAERAAKDFLAVILRKDSGGAVTQEEFDQYSGIFIPLPGDDAQTLQDKRDARQRAIDVFEPALGTARPMAAEVRAEFTKKKADKVFAAIPPGAIEKLKADPSLAAEFNKKYGTGMAERAMGGK